MIGALGPAAEPWPACAAERASLLSAAARIFDDETEQLCAVLLDASSNILAGLQGAQRRAAGVACVLAARRVLSTDRALRLPAVLEACGMTLECAIRELSPAAAALETALAGVLGSGQRLDRLLELRELKQAFVFNTLLAKKTRDIFTEYFSLAPDASPSAPLGFLWLLFCTARAALLPPQADLVTSFSLLLACTHFLLRHLPATQLVPAKQQQLGFAQPDELLAELAASHKAAEHGATIRQLAALLQALLAQLLQPAVPAVTQPTGSAAATQQQDHPIAEAIRKGPPAASMAADACQGWLLFPGLFTPEGQAASAGVEALQQRYRQLTADADIDALPFLKPGPSPAGEHGAASDADAAGAMQYEPSSQAAPGPSAPATGAATAAARGMPPAGHTASGGAAAMEVDNAGQPVSAAPPGEPGSPLGRQRTQAIDATPPRRIRPAAEDVADGSGLPEGCYRTPSPARRQLGQPPPPQPTPISAALGSAAWLQATVAGQPEGPTTHLQSLMRQAGVDEAAEAKLVAAAQGLAAAAFPDGAAPLQGPLPALEQSTTAARRSQGLRLYWHVLEGLVAGEAARPDAGPAAAASLLCSPLFNRCVAACAFECVISSYKVAALSFPAVLERLHLAAFDLRKAIEPFVRQLPSMPRDLKRHLLSVEEQCLESLAWQQGSSLYPALIAAVGTGTEPAGGSGPASSGSQPGAQRASCTPTPPGSQEGHVLEQQQAAGGSPHSSPSLADDSSTTPGHSAAAAEGSLTPRKRRREEVVVAPPAGADSDAELASDVAVEAPAQRRQPEKGMATTAGGEEHARSMGSSAPGQDTTAKQQQARTPASQLDLPLRLGWTPLTGPCADAQVGSSPQQQQQQQGRPQGDPSARAAVNEFFKGVLKLAAIRLSNLLGLLDTQPSDLQQLLAEAFTLAQHVASEHTWLLYGRHLDQILLCCLYSVCKLHQLPGVSFKSIIAAYKQQPQARADTFKHVSMRPRECTALHQLQPHHPSDIIAFYNQVFIPQTRPFLLRLADDPSLLVHPPVRLSPYPSPQLPLPAPHAGGIPSPPPMLPLGVYPASAQTPCLPPLAGFSGSPVPHGLLGTPTHRGTMHGSGGGAGMLLLSPGKWRFGGGGATPLASPGTDKMAALRVAGGPAVPPATRSKPSTPVSVPATLHMPGLPLSAATVPPPPLPLPQPPRLAPVFRPAATVAAAAATTKKAGPQVNGARNKLLPIHQQQRQEEEEEDEEDDSLAGMTDLPAESLPLLAAAAEAAAEIERKEQQLAAAFSSLCPAQPPAAPHQLQPASQAPGPALLPQAHSMLMAALAASMPAPAPHLSGAPHSGPLQARRVLALQPSQIQ